MTSLYENLIAQENAKIDLLRSKIQECERRIDVLRSFVAADEQDAFLIQSLGSNQNSPSISERASAHNDASLEPHGLPQRRLNDQTVSTLRFIGRDGKTLAQLLEYSKQQGWSQSNGALRSFATNYRQKFGFIDSPHNGFYRLTEVGEKYLASNYPELQGETPSVGAEGVSDTSTETAWRRTDSDGLI